MRFATQAYKLHPRLLRRALDFWNRFCHLWASLAISSAWFGGHSHTCYIQGLVIMQGNICPGGLRCYCSRASRHDNDDHIPRQLDEIYDLNRAVAKKMKDVFLSKGIPVVPSLGKFLVHFCGHFYEQRTFCQEIMIYGVCVPSLPERMTLWLTPHTAHVRYTEFSGFILLI